MYFFHLLLSLLPSLLLSPSLFLFSFSSSTHFHHSLTSSSFRLLHTSLSLFPSSLFFSLTTPLYFVYLSLSLFYAHLISTCSYISFYLSSYSLFLFFSSTSAKCVFKFFLSLISFQMLLIPIAFIIFNRLNPLILR